ncbi:TPA: Vir protein [Legionella pneumophila subsp. pneumophila]|uniref:Vir protein n=1 Tax=Legionella sp. PATHC039 TaxID=2992042 RepID=UPI001A29F396|nr:Vir protein [Legionella sp. PATHC039]MCW8396817.1 Vir protein [Legionella sp. PATHC039]HAT8858131.1 Vir protein [Legionella pneumophila subsp. pneumophila]HAT9650301.1 Vir protein [Legionella pneumophila subsp. pneumophila]HAT9920915.1 Vir protein [Legionella pneumophila subsp. pneumophila]
MDFLFVTTYELDALREIPLIQRVVYLMGIRPYMDRKTFMVGIKRKISYQSLRETLYVAPIKGVKTGCPSHQQMKCVIKSLARQGVIEIRSTTKNLIVKCLLANPYEPVEIESESQPKNSPPTQAEQNQSAPPENLKLMKTGKLAFKTKISRNLKDQYERFEQFWQLYPLPSYKSEAWKQFQQIDPDERLFAQIIDGLQNQLTKVNRSGAYWPYPASWLGQKSWVDCTQK